MFSTSENDPRALRLYDFNPYEHIIVRCQCGQIVQHMPGVLQQAIDAASVEAFVSGAALIIAHNAKFDRSMCEATWPLFRNFNWACSYTQIPRREEGHEGGKFGYLLNDYGHYHNGHRATDDCHALLYLLTQRLPSSKRIAMSLLLDNARKTEFQLWAENAPCEFKDVLKGRGYR